MRFLGGGVNGKDKITWVNWAYVFKPKKNGGLGVCDLRLVKLALLVK